jgi:thiamine-phosphate diphosphorylase
MPLPTRIGRLRLPVLCFVVGKADLKHGDVEKAVTEAVAGGVTMVQLHERGMEAGELLALARKLKSLTRGKALLMIDDRVDVAQAMEADGIQLPERGLPTRVARGLVGRYSVVGRSVHDIEGAQAAAREGAEFVIAGAVYKSTTEPDIKPAGVSLIADIAKDSFLPVLASGGITAEKVDELVKAGAAGVAVTSAIAGAEDHKAAAETITTTLKEAWANRDAPVSASA